MIALGGVGAALSVYGFLQGSWLAYTVGLTLIIFSLITTKRV